MENPRIKIAILEDQKILLDSFISLLKEDFEVVGAFQDADGILSFLRDTKTDVILADTCLKKTNMLDYLRPIKEKFPQVKVIIMTGYPEMSFLNKAKKEGADGFLYKNSSIDDTKQIIKDVCSGKIIFPDEKDDDGVNPLKVLNDREMVVLRFVCQGFGRKEIAQKMFYSENTIKSFITDMLTKTGFDSISRLAIYAVSHGYVVPENASSQIKDR